MKFKFLFGVTLALLVSCNKDSINHPVQKSAFQLLTQQEWMLKAAGFDDNRNNQLDHQENALEDCQKDNSYIFSIDGSGKALDNAVHCSAPIDNTFNWKFSNNNNTLEIGFSTLQIVTLNESDLVLIPDIPGLTVNYMLIYGH